MIKKHFEKLKPKNIINKTTNLFKKDNLIDDLIQAKYEVVEEKTSNTYHTESNLDVIVNNNHNEVPNKNPQKYSCIKLINDLKKQIESSTFNIQDWEQVNNKQPTQLPMPEQKNNTTKVNFNAKKKITIKNEIDLLQFYIENSNDEGVIPNKKITCNITGLQFHTVKRLNQKLKEQNKIYVDGQLIYLTGEE